MKKISLSLFVFCILSINSIALTLSESHSTFKTSNLNNSSVNLQKIKQSSLLSPIDLNYQKVILRKGRKELTDKFIEDIKVTGLNSHELALDRLVKFNRKYNIGSARKNIIKKENRLSTSQGSSIKAPILKKNIEKHPKKNTNIEGKYLFYYPNAGMISPRSSKQEFALSNINKLSYQDILDRENKFFAKRILANSENRERLMQDTPNTTVEINSKSLKDSKNQSNAMRTSSLSSDSESSKIAESNNSSLDNGNLPSVFRFRKMKRFPILDISSSGKVTWICGKDNRVYYSQEGKDFKVSANKESTPNGCSKITSNYSGFPVITDSSNKIYMLKKVYNNEFTWINTQVCAKNLAWTLNDEYYFLGCDDDKANKNHILKIDSNKNAIKVLNLESDKSMDNSSESLKKQLSELTGDILNEEMLFSGPMIDAVSNKETFSSFNFQKIAVALGGQDSIVIYLISATGKELWKYERYLWDKLAVGVNDLDVSDRNDVFYGTDEGVFVIERGFNEPRKIFSGKVEKLAAGSKLHIYSNAGILYKSIQDIA